MAGKRGELVPRPPKKMEYEIRFATTNARKGWQDLAATIRNPLAEAWDFLTRTPLAKTPSNYPLRGELGTITRGDKVHERWQHKPTIKGTARIWFFVDGRTVYLEQVHTSHPNETK
ncbi:hypothetical protein MGALJ_61710 (plasmid) [Mycobacterium gallinarum]|uniref:Uncharacterized protein n=1 Tax=Mycobacterium gallinarum TaxID=39689 RepID=A0A9W4B9Q7_9MYCO|nr:hypothetical protein [Mycobacterium gallinarum]BBY96502.1 hypothetical protein MGALJ_61710 [Mycobacterium gallinarum]